MAKKTIQEAVKFLVAETMKINTETAKWKFKESEIDKVIAVTKPNSIEYNMLMVLKKSAQKD
jgi:hypothetical protein